MFLFFDWGEEKKFPDYFFTAVQAICLITQPTKPKFRSRPLAVPRNHYSLHTGEQPILILKSPM